GERCAADRRLALHTPTPCHRAQDVHGLGAPGVDAVPRLLRDLPLAGGLASLRGTGLDPARLLPAAGLAHRAGGGDRPAGPHHRLPRAPGELRAAREDRALDAHALALRVGDRRARLLDAVPALATRRLEQLAAQDRDGLAAELHAIGTAAAAHHAA